MRPLWHAAVAIFASGISVAGTIFILVESLAADIGVSAGTAVTYIVPGCVQAALCLWIYTALKKPSALP